MAPRIQILLFVLSTACVNALPAVAEDNNELAKLIDLGDLKNDFKIVKLELLPKEKDPANEKEEFGGTLKMTLQALRRVDDLNKDNRIILKAGYFDVDNNYLFWNEISLPDFPLGKDEKVQCHVAYYKSFGGKTVNRITIRKGQRRE